jgi:hypothetical protein
MAAVAFVVLAWKLLQVNHEVSRHDGWFWTFRPGPASAWVALFAASIGWVLLRDNNARSMRPLLGSDSEWVKKSGLTQESDDYRQVTLKVGGTGSAVFRAVTWRLRLKGESTARQVSTLDELHARLKTAVGLIKDVDYAVMPLSRGAFLDQGARETYFECIGTPPLTILRGLILEFEAVFEFESMTGDRFRRAVSLLPSTNASAVPSTHQVATS